MKKVLRSIGAAGCAFALLVCSGGVSRAQDTLAITLEQALQIAESKSLTVKIADKEIRKSGYEKKGAYASLFPQVDFSGNYQRTIKKQVMAMKMNGATNKISVGTSNLFNAGFSASMPLVNFQLWRSLEITGKSVDLAVEKARQSRQDLINQVEQAFYGCLLASDSYEVYKENYENAKESYKETKAKYESGRVAKYDMIRAEVNMQNAEPNVYNALNSLTVALWQLKALIGVDLSSDIRCVGSLDDYADRINQISIASDSIDLSNNSTIRQLDIQSDILDETAKMQLASYYPSLAASFSYSWISMADNFKFKEYDWNPYSVAGLSLTIPIFSGGKRYYNVKQTRVQQEQIALQRENAERSLIVSVKQDLSSMENAVKQYNAAKSSIEGAEAGYSIARKRYEVGSGTVLEMNDALLALLQAKLNLKSSIYSCLTAKSNLDLTLGINANNPEEYGSTDEYARPKIIRYEEANGTEE